jgi:NitT/TauT family transport system substrate-binding protein
MIDRRQLIKGSTAGLLAAGAGWILTPGARAQGTQLKVKYDWLMSNGQVGDVVALKRGFLKDEGFDVEFIPGGPNSQTVPPVTSGQAVLGQFSSTNQAMVAAASDLPIKLIATGYRTAPFAYFSLPRAPVRKPEDLLGKRIGTQPTARYATDALIKKHNLDASKIQIINMGFDMTPLTSGQVDVVTGWVTNTKALSVIGPDRIDYMIREAGIYNYGNAYFTSNDAAQKYPDLIAKFLKAVSRGWEWTHANRAAAVDLMCDAYPQLEREVEHRTIDTVLKLTFDADTLANGWGWFDVARIQETIDLFGNVDFFKEKKKPRLDDFVTTRFLDATKDARAKIGA